MLKDMLKYHFGEPANPDAFGSSTTRDQNWTMVLLVDAACLTVIFVDLLCITGCGAQLLLTFLARRREDTHAEAGLHQEVPSVSIQGAADAWTPPKSRTSSPSRMPAAQRKQSQHPIHG